MTCPQCGAPIRAGTTFCGQCGGSLRPAAQARPTPQRCASCGAWLAGGQRFCEECGAAVSSGAPSSLRSHRQLGPPAAPGGALAMVTLVCAATSWAGWTPLSWPARILNALIPDLLIPDLYGCPYQPGSLAMYLCSAAVALVNVVGPAAVVLGIVLLRRPLSRVARSLISKLPEGYRYLAAPLLGTALFVAGWAAVHYATAASSGLLPQRLFPALLGILTYLLTQHGPAIQQLLRPFFDVRDRIPKLLRLAVSVILPLVVSISITWGESVSREALKEQIVVLVSIAGGYLLFVRRAGDQVRRATTALAAGQVGGQRA